MVNKEEYKKGKGLLERCGVIEIETTHSIWGLLDEEEALLPFEGDGHNIKNALLFESSSDDEDGTYPRVSDYIRCINSLDKEGTSYFLNRNRKKSKRLDIDWGGVRIIRDSQWDTEAELIFATPIEVVMGSVGGKNIILEVKRIKGSFTHEWFYQKNGRQDKKANGFEIWFNIEEYLE